MPNFRCPHCGSPVMIRGHRWECGWCGDSGEFRSQDGNNDASIESALEDLEQGVHAILNGMESYYHNEEEAKTPTWELTAYGITSALLKVGRVKSEAVRLLQVFYQRYPVCTAEDILSAVRQGMPAFASKYRLSALAVAVSGTTCLLLRCVRSWTAYVRFGAFSPAKIKSSCLPAGRLGWINRMEHIDWVILVLRHAVHEPLRQANS